MNDDRVSEAYKGEIWAEASTQRLRDRVHWMCSQVSGTRVLDVGCSQGIASILLAREGCEVVGIDVQQSRIDYAIGDLEGESEETRRRVRFMVADGADLPFGDATFDTVLLGEVVEHLAVPDRVLREIQRVLVTGGRLILTTPFGDSHHHSDHKQIFFPENFVEMVTGRFSIQQADIWNDYFLVVAISDGGGDAEKALRLLDDAVGRSIEATQQRLHESRQRAIRLQRQLNEARAKVDELRAELSEANDGTKTLSERLHVMVEDMDRLSRQVEDRDVVVLENAQLKVRSANAVRWARQSQERLDRLELQLWRTRHDLAIARWRREAMLNRKWWRLAGVLADVRNRPRRAALLPFDAIRVVSEPTKQVPRPGRPDKPKSSADSFEAASSSERVIQSDVSVLPGNSWVPPPPMPKRALVVATAIGSDLAMRFEHEWQQFPIEPRSWQSALATLAPQLLVVERGSAAHPAWEPAELRQVAERCRSAGVPLVLIDRSSEPAPDVAMASHAVVVACWDPEVADRYSESTAASVMMLGPAVQPRLHNPISVSDRPISVLFVEPDSSAAISVDDPLFGAARDLGLQVHRSKKSLSHIEWPESFEGCHGPPLGEVDLAVVPRMAKVSIASPDLNENSQAVDNALAEVASHCVVVASENSELDGALSGLVKAGGSEEEAANLIKALLRSDDLRSRFAHRAAREVFRSRTVSGQVDQILDKALGIETPPLPRLSMMVPTNRPEQIPNILKNLSCQTYPNMDVVLTLHGFDVDKVRIRDEAAELGLNDITFVDVDAPVIAGEVFNRGFHACEGEFIGKMDDDDFYGPEYAWDMMSTFDYSDAEIAGKWAHYTYLEGLDTTILRFEGTEHTYQPVVAISTLIMKREIVESFPFPAMQSGAGSVMLRAAGAAGARVYSADRFNYMYMRYRDAAHHTFPMSEFHLSARASVVCRGMNTLNTIV